MIRMKALRPFGYEGTNEGRVKRGHEFAVINEQRARDLENEGLAFRLDEEKMQPRPENKMQPAPAPENKAAEAGPLASPGGETGEDEPAPSSRRGRPRGRPRRQFREEED